MPNYDYKCNNPECPEKQFEIFQNMSDKKLKDCPYCDGSIKRMIGKGSGFVNNSGGFYKNSNVS